VTWPPGWLRARARGTRNARPVRRHATSSRLRAPRPWTYSAWYGDVLAFGEGQVATRHHPPRLADRPHRRGPPGTARTSSTPGAWPAARSPARRCAAWPRPTPPSRRCQASVNTAVDAVLAPPAVDRRLADAKRLGDLGDRPAGLDQVQHLAAELGRIPASSHAAPLVGQHGIQQHPSTEPGEDQNLQESRGDSPGTLGLARLLCAPASVRR
jgi:hypothetical protein